jgi:hypothetical protein
MVEITLQGLNPRQCLLADIIWSFETKDEINAFIDTLPKREAREARAIFEMMQMAVVEQAYDGITDEYPEADRVIKQVIDKLGR